jgi:hypothetical protein
MLAPAAGWVGLPSWTSNAVAAVADPGFLSVVAGAEDFRLQASSALRDMGAAVGEFLGAAPDVGVHEYGL